MLGAASLYIDYVPSESNPADVPSRVHAMSRQEAAHALAEFGREIDMVIPSLADYEGNWLSFTSIAASIWGS